MKYSVASVLAAILAVSGAHAQEGQPVDTDKPVEATEAPENQATDPESETGKLPLPDSGQPVAAMPAASAPTESAKWDVNAPLGTPLKQIAIRTDEGTWMDVDVSPGGRTIA